MSQFDSHRSPSCRSFKSNESAEQCKDKQRKPEPTDFTDYFSFNYFENRTQEDLDNLRKNRRWLKEWYGSNWRMARDLITFLWKIFLKSKNYWHFYRHPHPLKDWCGKWVEHLPSDTQHPDWQYMWLYWSYGPDYYDAAIDVEIHLTTLQQLHRFGWSYVKLTPSYTVQGPPDGPIFPHYRHKFGPYDERYPMVLPNPNPPTPRPPLREGYEYKSADSVETVRTIKSNSQDMDPVKRWYAGDNWNERDNNSRMSTIHDEYYRPSKHVYNSMLSPSSPPHSVASESKITSNTACQTESCHKVVSECQTSSSFLDSTTTQTDNPGVNNAKCQTHRISMLNKKTQVNKGEKKTSEMKTQTENITLLTPDYYNETGRIINLVADLQAQVNNLMKLKYAVQSVGQALTDNHNVSHTSLPALSSTSLRSSLLSSTGSCATISSDTDISQSQSNATAPTRREEEQIKFDIPLLNSAQNRLDSKASELLKLIDALCSESRLMNLMSHGDSTPGTNFKEKMPSRRGDGEIPPGDNKIDESINHKMERPHVRRRSAASVASREVGGELGIVPTDMYSTQEEKYFGRLAVVPEENLENMEDNVSNANNNCKYRIRICYSLADRQD